MCLLIAFYRIVPDYPMIIGANREELYTRPSLPPHIISTNPVVFGGIDQVAGGTWLGINKFGLLVGITNRFGKSPNPSYPSRGLLCLDLLQKNTSGDTKEDLEKLVQKYTYNPFHLFYSDSHSAHISLYENQLETHSLNPGIHIITTQGFNDNSISKINRVHSLLRDISKEFNHHFITQLKNILRDHEYTPPTKDTLCSHGEKAGTVSSAILAIHSSFPKYSFYYYSDGFPCKNPYKDYSHLFTAIVS